MPGQRSGGQKQLFPSFNLDEHIPFDHLLYGIETPYRLHFGQRRKKHGARPRRHREAAMLTTCARVQRAPRVAANPGRFPLAP